MAITLYPEQREAVDKLSNGKILRGGVGSGKTITSLSYFYEKICFGKVTPLEAPKKPTNLLVITTARKRDSLDWQKDAAQLAISHNKPEDSIGGIIFKVDSWNNIGKYEDIKDWFVIFDEQRLVGSGAWVKSFLKISKRNRWILLSATPADTWMDYVPVFLANGYFRNRTEFKREHVVYASWSKFPRVERYLGVDKLERLERELLVEMPYHKHTVRYINYIHVDYDKEMADKVVKERWHIYEDRPLRDAGEMFIVLRKLVGSHPSRLEAIRELIKENPRLVIFYNFNHELEALRTLSDVTTVAEWNGHKHQPVPEGESWVYLVQYAAGNEAWNCTTTDSMAFYTLPYSYKVFEQAQGRIDRRNTPYTNLNYSVLKSKSSIDAAVLKALKTKKNFSEKTFTKKFEGSFDNV